MGFIGLEAVGDTNDEGLDVDWVHLQEMEKQRTGILVGFCRVHVVKPEPTMI